MSEPSPTVYRCGLVFGSEIQIRAMFRGTYAALMGVPMPEDAIEEVTEPRGFMIGVGQTMRFTVVMGDATIRTEDWWEDNIADPEEYEFEIAARSPEALERAAAAVIATAAGFNWPLRERR